jgi:hypothetical protein
VFCEKPKLIAPESQACYTNSSEVLFATLCFYNLRVLERLWGSRKFAVGPHPFTPQNSSFLGVHITERRERRKMDS